MLVGAEGLAAPAEARIVRAGKDGTPQVTDGPFAEAKEFLAGYWIVEVESARARLRDCGARIGSAGPRRRAAEHADRSAAGDERAQVRVDERTANVGPSFSSGTPLQERTMGTKPKTIDEYLAG